MCKKAYMEANFSTSFSGGMKWLESPRRLLELLEWSVQRRDLATWLRSLADLVESDALACEPIAATVVLSGHAADEVLHMGYGEKHSYFNDVASAVAKVAGLSPDRRAGESHHPRTT